MGMKERKDNEKIDDDSIQYTTDDIQKEYLRESIENLLSFSRSEETITLNSSLSNIEDSPFNSSYIVDTSKKFRDITDFLNNRIKKNVSECKKDNGESDSKDNLKLYMKQQDSSDTEVGKTLPQNIYCDNNSSEKHSVSLNNRDSIVKGGSSLTTTTKEGENYKQTENSEKLDITHDVNQNLPLVAFETPENLKTFSNETQTKLSQDFIPINTEGISNLSESHRNNNEILETFENQSNNSLSLQNTEPNDLQKNLSTNNKISQLFTKSDKKFSLEDLLHSQPVITSPSSTKPGISTQDFLKDNIQPLKHQQIEDELQNLKISDSETKASSIYDLLKSKRTSTENNDDPFAFLKKPLKENPNPEESKTKKTEDSNTEFKQPLEVKENNEALKNFLIINSQNDLKQIPDEKINLEKNELKEGTKVINCPPKGLYKIKRLNSEVSIKEYNRNINKSIVTETVINSRNAEPLPIKNVLRKNLDNKTIKKIPSQVHLQKSKDSNSIIFGQTLKSYYSDIPHNCQLIKFTDKYFKTKDYTEGSPENYLKLLYSNKLNLGGSLKDLLLKGIEINSSFLITNCPLLMAKFFIELITALNKTRDIENLEIFEEFVCKYIQIEFQFSFKLFYNCLLGNLIQTPSNKNTNINFEDFLNLTISFMDLLKNDIKLLSLYALQITKNIEHISPSQIPFLLFMFYKKYDINIFSFFTEFLLKEELYTSILLYEDIQLHSKSCIDNFLFSFVGINKLSDIPNWEILVNQIHKECEKCLKEFLKWKYMLLGKNEEFNELSGKSNVLSSIFKSVSSAIIGVAEETKSEIVEDPSVFNSLRVSSSNISSTNRDIHKDFVGDINKDFISDIHKDSTKDTSIASSKDTSKDKEGKELEEKPVETKGILSSLSTLIFGKPTEIPPNKKEGSKSLFNFLSPTPKTNQTFKVKPQDTQFIYKEGEWVSTRKIDKKKKHEEYMRKLQKERSEKTPTLPTKPITTKPTTERKKAEVLGSPSLESKYPQKATKFLTPIKKVNIPQSKRLKPLIKTRNEEDEFFAAPLKTTESKTSEPKNSEENPEPKKEEDLKTKNVKTESVNDFDKI